MRGSSVGRAPGPEFGVPFAESVGVPVAQAPAPGELVCVFMEASMEIV